jgi:endonuclease-3
VVINQAFGQPAFAGGYSYPSISAKVETDQWEKRRTNRKRFKKPFPKESWGDLHLQIIFYGREFCLARKCYGLECKLCTTLFPKRRSKV